MLANSVLNQVTNWYKQHTANTRWCPQMETFSALLAFCTENAPVTSEFPTQRTVTQSFDVFFDLRQNQQSVNSWANNGDAGDFRRYRAHYDVPVMSREIRKACNVFLISLLLGNCIMRATFLNSTSFGHPAVVASLIQFAIREAPQYLGCPL